MNISLLNEIPTLANNLVILLSEDYKQLPAFISQNNQEFIKAQIALEKKLFPFFENNQTSWVVLYNEKTKTEDFRKLGSDLASLTQNEKVKTLTFDGSGCSVDFTLAFAEGFALSGYRFLKYFKDEEKKKQLFHTNQIDIYHPEIKAHHVQYLLNTTRAVFWCRTMVNEPVNFMNAPRFAKEVAVLGQEADFKVDILDKKKIETLKMGGLLAVNKGSIDPPTFTICEWKPENAANKKPYVIVGKGVMYDTGGMSLKPTPNSMDIMKCDMAGAAAIAGSIYAVALNKIPVWVIALLPATDNRPDGNAYVPGDIIKMYNGLNVEVLNTDAEGRMILADALSYGDKYEPDLVIDMATLTGSAHAAIGEAAAVFMGNANEDWFSKLETAGTNVHERLVRFPFWDDYKESLKSTVADLKNLGKREAGAISAGKFLEHFTTSPYIHIDIAGPSFLNAADAYRTVGGSGFGVRLMTEFFKNISNTQ